MPDENAPRAVIEILMQAARVRRAVEAELRQHRISFALWWVLYVTDSLVRDSQDAVSQQAIALATELSRSTVSYLMSALSARALVSRGPDGLDYGYRIFTTAQGRAMVEATQSALARGLQRARAMPRDPSCALAYCLARLRVDE